MQWELGTVAGAFMCLDFEPLRELPSFFLLCTSLPYLGGRLPRYLSLQRPAMTDRQVS
jgi:hypothetical protein